MQKNQKNKENLREREWYREKITEITSKIESVDALKKIYTVAKTHMDILGRR